MSEMSPGLALRQLQHVHSTLKKARQALRFARRGDNSEARQGALRIGWQSLLETHRLLSEIPLESATEPVMTKQLSVERYATALLVRLRRLVRNEPAGAEDEDPDDLE